MTPEVQQRISILRSKMVDGSATIEELKEAVILLREGRKSAAAANASSKKTGAAAKPKAAIAHADDMLDELGGK